LEAGLLRPTPDPSIQPALPQPSWLIPAVLMLASTVGILATDLYTPSLPRLTVVFGVPAETVQLTMTLNLAGFALGQLLYGPLSDRYGRRPAMLCGLVAFALFSGLCAMAWSIESLIGFRIGQGLVGACEAVIGMAVIKELYGEKDGVKIVAIYAMVIAAAPALGPIIGGQMLVHFGWASNFWLLAGLAVVAFAACWRFLVETCRPDRSALRPSRLLVEARAVLSVPAFWLYTLGPAAVLAGLFAYVTEGPFVLINQLGVPADAFGYYHAVIVAAFIATNIIVNRVASRVSGAVLLRLGSLAAVASGGLGLALAAGDALTAYGLVVVMSLFTVSLALIYAVAPLQALASTKAATGMAASWRGFLEMSGGMLGSAGVTALHDGTPWPLVIVLAVAALCVVAGDLGARRLRGPGSLSDVPTDV
jgi:MFS transporter, DHA1 family, multidrug resistance protein